jgi:Fe-S-cluster containining protein
MFSRGAQSRAQTCAFSFAVIYNPRMIKGPWYADGLRFACTHCGGCCTGPTGYVWCSDEEAGALAGALKIDVAEFLSRYTRVLHGRRSLTEVHGEFGYDCVLLRRSGSEQTRCAAYDVRPTQCRTWPFWPENLASPEQWRHAGARCPGVAAGMEGRGRLYVLPRIDAQSGLCEPRIGAAVPPLAGT